jgi:hypothetical protein
MPRNDAAVKKDPQAILWVHTHRSVLTIIAARCGVSAQFVGYVLYGQRRSRDGMIERLLREAGAPLRSGMGA